MLKKRYKLIPFVIIIIALVIALFQGIPKPYLTVGELLMKKDEYINKKVEVRGVVANFTGWEKKPCYFNLVWENSKVLVIYNGTVLQNFKNGTTVYITGILREYDSLTIEAEKIIVGCPSRYGG
ncbi:MAG: cytochrome c maturation protein CcmE [Candidatus Thermoplasmatota archaeon]